MVFTKGRKLTMRKISSNLFLNIRTECAFFICRQADGYRIIKGIQGKHDYQICTYYQNGYGILLSEDGNILLSIDRVIERMEGKKCLNDFNTSYQAKQHLLAESAMFLSRSAIPIVEVEDSKESYTTFDRYAYENDLDAFILCQLKK